MIKSFYVAKDAGDALRRKRDLDGRGMFLAGGTEINRLGSSLLAEKVISIRHIGCDKIEEADGVIRIGSCVTFQRLIDSPLVPCWLKDAAKYCNSRTKRNMATIGGNLAIGRDDSYLMPALLAAKARLLTAGLTEEGVYTEDELPIREYHAFQDHFSGTLILAVVLNKPDRFVATRRFSRTAQSHAAVTVGFGSSRNEAGNPSDVRIYAAVKGSGIQRFADIENSIEGDAYNSPEDVQFAVSAITKAVDDLAGSAAYKRYLAGVAVSDLYRLFLDSTGGAK